MKYFLNILIWLDQGLNTLRGGHPDETLSAWFHRLHLRGWSQARNFTNALFFWQKDHCKEAYESESIRRHLPREYAE